MLPVFTIKNHVELLKSKVRSGDREEEEVSVVGSWLHLELERS